MKRNLLLASLAAVATVHRQQTPPEPKEQPLPVEPGHVMRKATYERLVREQQK